MWWPSNTSILFKWFEGWNKILFILIDNLRVFNEMCYANRWLMVKEFIFKTYVFSGFWVLTITPPLFSEDFKVTTFFVFQLTQFLEMWDKSVYKYIFDLLNKYFWIKLVDLSKLKSKYLKALKSENLKRWTIHKRHLSDVPVSRNW